MLLKWHMFFSELKGTMHQARTAKKSKNRKDLEFT
jgi:hypothetical protein